MRHRFHHSLRRLMCGLVCVAVLVGGFSPAVLAGGGKKHYKEGLKYETAKEWDKAAEEYTLALNEDPGNGEYILRQLRALQNASLMFMDRARLLAEQKDYEGAYQAYRQAYNFDRTNELALARMKEMLFKQGIPANNRGEPDFSIQKTKDTTQQVMESTVQKQRRRKDYLFPGAETLENIIFRIATDDLRFNVLFEQQARGQAGSQKPRFDLRDIQPAKALELLLDTYNLSYIRADRRTLLIYSRTNPQIAQKYDEPMVKTFYIRNAKTEEIRSLIQNVLKGDPGQMAENKQLNALTVRSAPENLKLIERLIQTLDKPQAEVVMDVNIYEITQDDALRIGNQFRETLGQGQSGSTLQSLGGIGAQGLRAAAGQTAGAFSSALGLGIVVPPSTLSFFQSRGKSRLVAQTQLHSFEDKEAKVNIGRQVPIQTAAISSFGFGNSGVPGAPGQPNNGNNNQFFGGIPQIQYRDVGLNIQIKPKVIDDLVQMELSIESSNVLASTAASLTPTFTQRKMTGVARVRDGQTTIAASVMQQDDTDSRSGIPFLSMLPGIGSLFTTPQRDKRATHIIIAITPHILRGGAVTEDEEKLQLGPLNFTVGPFGQAYGRQQSIEEIQDAAEKEEMEEANQRAEATSPTRTQRTSGPMQPNFVPARVETPGIAAPQSMGPDGIVRAPQPPAATGQPIPLKQAAPPASGQSPTASLSVGTVPATSLTGSTATPATDTTPGASTGAVPANGQPGQGAPVPVILAVYPTVKPQVGQVLQVAAIVNGSNQRVSAASLLIQYNPAVLKVLRVQDGGLFQPGTFQGQDSGGSITVNATVAQSTGAISAVGQVVLIEFQVVGGGEANLNLSSVDLRGPDGNPIPIAINPAQPVTATGRPNQP